MCASKLTTNATTARMSQSQMTQNWLLVWIDANIDQNDKECQNIVVQLRAVVDNVNLFTQPNQCIDFLLSLNDEKAIAIISGSLGERLVSDIHHLSSLDTIYIFCSNKSRHEQWTKRWTKVKGVHTNITHICQAVQMNVRQYHQNSISVSFVGAIQGTTNEKLNQLDPTFMYTQIFKDILLHMNHDQKALQNLVNYCRSLYIGKGSQLQTIDEFEKNYRADDAIWWYTRECFTYQMLNYALRNLESETIIKMGFFMHDIHQQIVKLYKQQIGSYGGKCFIVYRGQGLGENDFERLKKTTGGLMSFNNFLSTSKEVDVSLDFAKGALAKQNMVGILFVMTIDPSVRKAAFASIKEVSYFKAEEEILFSMHTVFRVGAIKQLGKNKKLYEVKLQLTSDDDKLLRILTERIRKECIGDTAWERIGNLLLKIGHFREAEELYRTLLEETSDESDQAVYYSQLGYVKNNQGSYVKAIEYYRQALKIQEKSLPSNHLSLATSYGNIGCTYDKMGEYSMAIKYYQKSIEIFEKTLSLNHQLLAISYNNIGGIYEKVGESSKALSYYQKAVELQKKMLPANHPHLATSYGNIGLVYSRMGEYSKALSYYQNALEIREKSLPSNHPEMAISYGNIGCAYSHMGEYSKALLYYQKALELEEKILSASHPDIAVSCNNIGMVYKSMREYSKALSYYQKAVEIQEKNLSSNHPDLALSYNNIGTVYWRLGEYSKALSYYQNAIEIQEKALPSNHHHLATSYNNIGSVYNNMREYSKALSYYRKALEIEENSLSSNHPDLAVSYNNLASLYENMKDYSKALTYYQRALNIFKTSLPENHPNIKIVRKNIDLLKQKL